MNVVLLHAFPLDERMWVLNRAGRIPYVISGQGQVKALANGELRWRFLSVAPWNQRLDFTLVSFLDAGQAWTGLR